MQAQKQQFQHAPYCPQGRSCPNIKQDPICELQHKCKNKRCQGDAVCNLRHFMKKPCPNGPQCKFLARGNCTQLHDDVVQPMKPIPDQQQAQLPAQVVAQHFGAQIRPRPPQAAQVRPPHSQIQGISPIAGSNVNMQNFGGHRQNSGLSEQNYIFGALSPIVNPQLYQHSNSMPDQFQQPAAFIEPEPQPQPAAMIQQPVKQTSEDEYLAPTLPNAEDDKFLWFTLYQDTIRKQMNKAGALIADQIPARANFKDLTPNQIVFKRVENNSTAVKKVQITKQVPQDSTFNLFTKNSEQLWLISYLKALEAFMGEGLQGLNLVKVSDAATPQELITRCLRVIFDNDIMNIVVDRPMTEDHLFARDALNSLQILAKFAREGMVTLNYNFTNQSYPQQQPQRRCLYLTVKRKPEFFERFHKVLDKFCELEQHMKLGDDPIRNAEVFERFKSQVLQIKPQSSSTEEEKQQENQKPKQEQQPKPQKQQKPENSRVQIILPDISKLNMTQLQNIAGSQIFIYKDVVLGRGSGDTVVYKGFNTQDKRDLAVKKIRSDRAKQIEREVQALVALKDHQNIVPYRNCYVDGEYTYIALDLSHGTLDDIFQMLVNPNCFQNSPEKASIVQIFKQHYDKSDKQLYFYLKWLVVDILQGIAYLHQNNLLHRDIKPQNILISDSDGKGKFSDFGMAAKIEDQNTHVSTSSTGTFGYVPFEVFQDNKARPQSDIFALGVVIYQLLSNGLHPFGNTLHERILNIQMDKFNLQKLFENKERLGVQWLEAAELITSMIQQNWEMRPSAKSLLNHPFNIRDEQDRVRAIGEARLVMKTNPMIAENVGLNYIQQLIDKFPGVPKYQNWVSQIDQEVLDQGKTKYDAMQLGDLIRFVRNQVEHIDDTLKKNPQMSKYLGRTQVSCLNYFIGKFPWLMLAAYKILGKF